MPGSPAKNQPNTILHVGPLLTRRGALRSLAVGLALLPVIACVGDDEGEGSGTTGDGTSSSTGDGTSSSTSDETSSSGTTDASTTSTSTSTSAGSTTDGAACDEATAWATGGTAAMTKKECYPDPFAAGVTTCALICQTTEGPCTAPTTARQDVSEGYGGLPMRLALKFVRADSCEPVVGATVEIWHTQRTGVYSGQTPNPQMCAGGDADAPNHNYFRGTQTTDANGRVDFDSCFPGWYNGRALHIHFRVTIDGQSYVVSQLFFSDAITAEIFSTHPEYVEFGQPNTSNDTDNVIGGESDLSNYVLDIARMADGAMMASKVVAIRSSTADALCTAQGGGGGGMMP